MIVKDVSYEAGFDPVTGTIPHTHESIKEEEEEEVDVEITRDESITQQKGKWIYHIRFPFHM